MVTLRLRYKSEVAGQLVEVALDGVGAPRTATARFNLDLTAQDREDLRWYLEEYLEYPLDPAPLIASRIENRLSELGRELFTAVFEASRDTKSLWDAAAMSMAGIRLEVAAGVEGSAAVPWELLRDPATDRALALSVGAFVRTHSETTRQVALPEAEGALRVLLVICRPGGRDDVPFRSVASHLVRLSSRAREAFQLDVLRPPTFAQLARVLDSARAAGAPYQVVHFDGHGSYLDETALTAAAARGVPGLSSRMFSTVSPPRPGAHGFLIFEDPGGGGRQQLVDGPALGGLLADAGVPVLVLNACRSAHADLVTAPETVTGELDAHQRVRAYGSLAQEVMDAGVAGVVAMRYNVYVDTAARFIGEVYAGLLEGRELGAAASAARKQLAAHPMRSAGVEPVSLQDWVVPVVYEAAPFKLRSSPQAGADLVIELSQAEAGRERAGLEPGLPGGPNAGFFGRDETLLALDRAFDDGQLVLLQAWAGAGKTATALEFARWYGLTGGVDAVLFASFEHHLAPARLLDQVGDRFGAALERSGVQWAALDQAGRREVALQVLAQVPVLWIWDNVEPVAGFPAGTPSAWSAAEQDELLAFLRDLAARTRCKVLLTSRRDERDWLGDLPVRVRLPPMPMLERLELARGIAGQQAGGAEVFEEVADWRPLLEFTRGNPLAITILTRQVIHDHRTTKEQLDTFVAELAAGAATVTDDDTQGRSASLAASLDYGFTTAFTDNERAQLALLVLFQGFVNVLALCAMGHPGIVDEPVPAVAGLTRDEGISLLARAAEVGLLTGDGDYYAIHPAVPWHLRNLYEHYHGLSGSPADLTVVHSWLQAYWELAGFYHQEYRGGSSSSSGVIRVLAAEENNLLTARRIALEHGWAKLAVAPMQGLLALYYETGRAAEWGRLVAELVPSFTDPATGGPLPGLEMEWNIVGGYQIRIAIERNGDMKAAARIARSRVAWEREKNAALLAMRPDELDDRGKNDIRGLAVSIQELGHVLFAQADPACVAAYLEAADLFHRIAARRDEATIASNLAQIHVQLPDVRDLDEAERWCRRRIELLDDDDMLARARSAYQLGEIAFSRLTETINTGAADPQQQSRYLQDAVTAYRQALDLAPPVATEDQARINRQLGLVYALANDARNSLHHLQRSIRYDEQMGNLDGAADSRSIAAALLADAGSRQDALMYARAALRDLTALGEGSGERARPVRQLISQLEQQPPAAP